MSLYKVKPERNETTIWYCYVLFAESSLYIAMKQVEHAFEFEKK